MSAQEILLRCLALSERFDTIDPAAPEITQQSAELLSAIVAWYSGGNTLFSNVEDHHAYSRRELYRDNMGEILAMRWAPGRVTAPHDHAEARGLVFLLDQGFTERRFEFHAEPLSTRDSQSGHWVAGAATQLQAPRVLRVSPGVVHDMCCTGAGTSIHVYFPAISGMRVFDLPTRTIWHVTEDAGAWLPDHPSQVVRREHW